MLLRPSRCGVGWNRTTFDAVATSHQLAALVPLGPEPLRKVAALTGGPVSVVVFWGLTDLLPLVSLQGSDTRIYFLATSTPRRGFASAFQISPNYGARTSGGRIHPASQEGIEPSAQGLTGPRSTSELLTQVLRTSTPLCLSTSRANPAHVLGYHTHGRLKRDPCSILTCARGTFRRDAAEQTYNLAYCRRARNGYSSSSSSGSGRSGSGAPLSSALIKALARLMPPSVSPIP